MKVSVHVNCYSGYTYAQEPRALEWHGRRYEVKRIVKRWRTPEGPCFRVEVAGGQQLSEFGIGGGEVGNEGIGFELPTQISNVVDLVYVQADDRWIMTA